jgi:hypothetical protein
MGGHDRATPIKRIQPEGIGTPPDVFVPYEPMLLERHGDPVLAAGSDILLYLIEGSDRNTVVDFYGGILGHDPGLVRRSIKDFMKLETPDRKKGFADVTDGVIASMADWEIALCESGRNPMPDFKGAAVRLAALAEIAGMLEDEKTAKKSSSAATKWDDEIAAQKAYEAMIAEALPPEEKSLKAYLSKHGDTRYGKAARDAFGSGRR